jgi:hypothetical protein
MDDISIKGPKIIYNNEKVISGIRKYILKHIILINKILVNLERVKCTISGIKS